MMSPLMLASSFIATLLSAVAFGCFAFAAGLAGRPRAAAVFGTAAWLLAAVAVALLLSKSLVAD